MNASQDPMAEAAAAAVEALVQPRHDKLRDGFTLERLATDPQLGAFNASPVQRALMRASDGQPLDDILPPDRMLFHFGCERLQPIRPRLVVLRTGVRAGKSFISAMALMKSILTCKFRREPDIARGEVPDADGMVGVRYGELVRALIVAPLMKLSRAPLHHLIGATESSPLLSRMLIKKGTESCVIRRLDGREVTVELVAASSGGANLRSTWLAGVILDEADFHDDEDGAVNLPDNLRAAMPRLLAGAQAWVPSSPWADTGPFHDLFTGAHGSPGRTLAFHSDTRSMNPTLDAEDEAAERARDPDNAAREYDAVPLSASSSMFLPLGALTMAVRIDRTQHLEPLDGVIHYGGADLGFRKNSSALALARFENRKVRLAYHEEIVPPKGAPLKPSQVCKQFAEIALAYHCHTVKGDMHYADTAQEEFEKVTAAEESVWYAEWNPSADAQTEVFTEFKRRLVEGLIELPNDPRLLSQLKSVTSRPLPGGRIQVQMPKRGRTHGDVAMAVVLACTQVQIGEPDEDYSLARAGRRRW